MKLLNQRVRKHRSYVFVRDSYESRHDQRGVPPILSSDDEDVDSQTENRLLGDNDGVVVMEEGNIAADDVVESDP